MRQGRFFIQEENANTSASVPFELYSQGINGPFRIKTKPGQEIEGLQDILGVASAQTGFLNVATINPVRRAYANISFEQGPRQGYAQSSTASNSSFSIRVGFWGHLRGLQQQCKVRKFAEQPLEEILRKITEAEQDEDYDEDNPRPTDFAFKLSKILVIGAYGPIDTTKLPHPHVSPTEAEGIRIWWMTDEKDVMVYCDKNSTSESYIYHQHNKVYKGEPGVTIEKLAYWLQWLLTK